MSTADILAAARAKKTPGAEPAAAPAETTTSVPVPKAAAQKLSTADILAQCRAAGGAKGSGAN
jgi:hypothetical protein